MHTLVALKLAEHLLREALKGAGDSQLGISQGIPKRHRVLRRRINAYALSLWWLVEMCMEGCFVIGWIYTCVLIIIGAFILLFWNEVSLISYTGLE